MPMRKSDRIAELRAWYVYRIGKRVRQIPVRALCTPVDDWYARCWIGLRHEPQQIESPRHVWVSAEPTDRLDAEGCSWSAWVHIPDCCVPDATWSAAIEIDLDELENHQDGTSRLQRGTGISDAAVTAAQAWSRHAAHPEPSSRPASFAEQVPFEPAPAMDRPVYDRPRVAVAGVSGAAWPALPGDGGWC